MQNNLPNEKINNLNRLTNFLMTSSNLTSQKMGIIQNCQKNILPQEYLNQQINDSAINDFISKLHLFSANENEEKEPEENLSLNSELAENISTKENSKFIAIFLFSLFSKNNLGKLHSSLTKKLAESFIYLKSLEDFFKNSIEQFEKIHFILNEKAKQFIGN